MTDEVVSTDTTIHKYQKRMNFSNSALPLWHPCENVKKVRAHEDTNPKFEDSRISDNQSHTTILGEPKTQRIPNSSFFTRSLTLLKSISNCLFKENT